MSGEFKGNQEQTMERPVTPDGGVTFDLDALHAAQQAHTEKLNAEQEKVRQEAERKEAAQAAIHEYKQGRNRAVELRKHLRDKGYKPEHRQELDTKIAELESRKGSANEQFGKLVVERDRTAQTLEHIKGIAGTREQAAPEVQEAWDRAAQMVAEAHAAVAQATNELNKIEQEINAHRQKGEALSEHDPIYQELKDLEQRLEEHYRKYPEVAEAIQTEALSEDGQRENIAQRLAFGVKRNTRTKFSAEQEAILNRFTNRFIDEELATGKPLDYEGMMVGTDWQIPAHEVARAMYEGREMSRVYVNLKQHGSMILKTKFLGQLLGAGPGTPGAAISYLIRGGEYERGINGQPKSAVEAVKEHLGTLNLLKAYADAAQQINGEGLLPVDFAGAVRDLTAHDSPLDRARFIAAPNGPIMPDDWARNPSSPDIVDTVNALKADYDREKEAAINVLLEIKEKQTQEKLAQKPELEAELKRVEDQLTNFEKYRSLVHQESQLSNSLEEYRKFLEATKMQLDGTQRSIEGTLSELNSLSVLQFGRKNQLSRRLNSEREEHTALEGRLRDSQRQIAEMEKQLQGIRSVRGVDQYELTRKRDELKSQLSAIENIK